MYSLWPSVRNGRGFYLVVNSTLAVLLFVAQVRKLGDETIEDLSELIMFRKQVQLLSPLRGSDGIRAACDAI